MYADREEESWKGEGWKGEGWKGEGSGWSNKGKWKGRGKGPPFKSKGSKGKGKGLGGGKTSSDNRLNTVRNDRMVKTHRLGLVSRAGGYRDRPRQERVVDRVNEDFLLRHCEVREAHEGAITSMMMTGTGVFTASTDGFLKMWAPERHPDGKYTLRPPVEKNLNEQVHIIVSQGDWMFCGLQSGKIWGKSPAQLLRRPCNMPVLETTTAIGSLFVKLAPTCLKVLEDRTHRERDLTQTRDKIRQAHDYISNAELLGATPEQVQPLINTIEELSLVYESAIQGKAYHEQNTEDAQHGRFPTYFAEQNAWRWCCGWFRNSMELGMQDVDRQIDILSRFVGGSLPPKPPPPTDPPRPSHASACPSREQEGPPEHDKPKHEAMTYVVIKDIASKPELNLQVGFILMYEGGPDKRYRVLISTGEQFKLRESCLRSIVEFMIVPVSAPVPGNTKQAATSATEAPPHAASPTQAQPASQAPPRTEREPPAAAGGTWSNGPSPPPTERGPMSHPMFGSPSAGAPVQGPSSSQQGQASGALPLYAPNSHVVLQGLNSVPELNGHVGQVLSYVGGPERRYHVFVGGKMICPRESCLSAFRPTIGVPASAPSQTVRPAGSPYPAASAATSPSANEFEFTSACPATGAESLPKYSTSCPTMASSAVPPPSTGSIPKSSASSPATSGTSPTGAPQQTVPSGAPTFAPGSLVVINGLEKRTELNLKVAQVLTYLGGEDKRYTVLVMGEHISVKETKLLRFNPAS